MSRRVVVHSLADARAALAAAEELGVPVTLVSAEGAGASVGALWFKMLLAEARAKADEVEQLSPLSRRKPGPRATARHLPLGPGFRRDSDKDRNDILPQFLLDCGDQAGRVLAGLRAGFRHLRFTGSAAQQAALAALAEAYGAVIEGDDIAPALDLLDSRDPEASCRSFLAPSGTDT